MVTFSLCLNVATGLLTGMTKNRPRLSKHAALSHRSFDNVSLAVAMARGIRSLFFVHTALQFWLIWFRRIQDMYPCPHVIKWTIRKTIVWKICFIVYICSTVELLITDPLRSDHPLYNGQPLWHGLASGRYLEGLGRASDQNIMHTCMIYIVQVWSRL